MFDSFLADLRHALRALLQQRGFFAACVLTLALGIGALAAIFTVYNAVLLKPLPYVDAERIVRVARNQPPISAGPVSKPVFEEWRDGSRDAFEAFAGVVDSTMNLGAAGSDAERLGSAAVTPDFWRVFGVPLALGRGFGDAEESHNERVVVLAHALWQRRFGAAADIVGRDVLLNGESYRVVGVAAADFDYPAGTQVWLPTFLPANSNGRGTNFIAMVARLKPGVAAANAATALAGVVAWQTLTFPDASARMSARVDPLQAALTGNLRQPLGMLLAAATLVLLIACANLANLMLARGQARGHEFALRGALGAGRGRLVRSVLAEAGVIALCGGALGVLAAQPAVNALMALAPKLLPLQRLPGVDLRVIAVSLGAAVVTLVVFGLAPAWRATRVDPALAMRSGGRAVGGGRGESRLRAVLVSAEIALALTLLSGTGLLIESLRRLGDVDAGVRSEQVLTARLALPVPSVKPGEDFLAWAERVKAINAPRIDALLARVRALPGVASAALVDSLPISGGGGGNGEVNVVGRDVPKDANITEFRFVSPDYFATLGIPLHGGRVFDAHDGEVRGFGTRVLVNQAFVDHFLAGGSPIGQQLGVLDDEVKTIVGVVGDVRQFDLERAAEPEVYFPVDTLPSGDVALALRASGDPAALAEPLRRALHEVAADMPVFAVRTMDEATRETTRLRRFNLGLMGVFAGVAVALSAIGLYGVIAYAVGRRRREIGVRQALGAGSRDIQRLMLGAGLRMIVPGLAAGVVGALLLGRLIATQLYGIGAADPFVLAAVAALLAAIAVAACALPTWRAARLPPLEALRDD